MITPHLRLGVVVGNPRPQSRTLEAALALAERLGGADTVVDLAEVAAELFDLGSTRVDDLVARVSGCGVVVVASPTYKAT